MEAKPLKTIPEETVALKTSNKNITSDVPKTKPATAKNPGRVASGERLAERNRLAREVKKTSQSTTNKTSGYLILAFGGLIVSALDVYYQREAIMKTLGRPPKTQTTAPAESNTVVEDVVAPKRKYGLHEMK